MAIPKTYYAILEKDAKFEDLEITGAITATGGVTGDVTGNVTGGVTRPVSVTATGSALTAAQSGTVIIVTAADQTFTLPSTSAGIEYTFILAAGGLSTGTGLSISPAAADAIHGGGLTSVDNKDLILAGSGDAEGDTVTLVGDGVDGWYITSVVGTWSKEA